MSDDGEVERWAAEFELHAPPDWRCPKCGADVAYFFTNCPAYLPSGKGCYERKPQEPEK